MSAVVVVLAGLTVWNTVLALFAWAELGDLRRDVAANTRSIAYLADRERAAYYREDKP